MKEKILAANARYSAKVDALLSQLASFDNERLNRKSPDGGWSAIQTLHHLMLVEENSLAYLRKKLSFNPPLEKAGPWAWWRSLLLRISLQSPIKFKAPKSAGTERIPETDTLEVVLTRWQKIRAEWLDFFEKMPADLLDKAAYKHPRAGRLSWIQMLDFFAIHFDRHRRQVQRAIS
ncbi:MAG: DinB family protein [Saprospiraceae bacterium]|nr:DinB family protein [Saprospiraceae bacterium]